MTRGPAPRLADALADTLRKGILRGEYEDGSLLPKQDELAFQFGMSLPTVRDALRTLEDEGLITVRRGTLGGSVVQRPKAGKVAYMLGLVLESEAATIDDVVWALQQIEPLCGRACANRTDRRRAVVPALLAEMEIAVATIDQPAEFVRAGRRYHDVLVRGCGNLTLRTTIGALQDLWAAQLQGVSSSSQDLGEYAGRRARERSLAEHGEITAAITAGDADMVEKLLRGHRGELGYLSRRQLVDASLIRELRPPLVR